MTPEQAEQVANELLEQRRRVDLDARNARTRRVPFACYVRGLDTLEPWERSELVRVASRHLASQWKIAALAIGLVALCCGLWWLFGLFDRKDVSPALLVIVIAGVAYLPRTYLVRKEIRRRLELRVVPQGERPREA